MRLGLIPPRPDENRPERYGVPVLGELTVYAKNPSAETAEAWSVTRGLLKQMKEDSESHGANFLIFHVPARMSIYAGEWEGFTWNYALAAEDWDARQVSRDLMQFCDRESIRCIDPTDQFVETTKALAPHGSRLYYQRDEHWNPNGHRLAATVLADYVSNQLGISP